MKGMNRMFSIHTTQRAGLAVAIAALAWLACGTQPAAAAVPPAVAAGVPQRRDFVDLGRAPRSTPIQMSLVLRYRNDDELTRLIAAQSDLRSPMHGRYLTNQQFNDFFAPGPQDYARAVAALAKAGFRVDQTFSNRTVVSASAPAVLVERYFSTQIHLVNQRGYGLRYANGTTAIMPAELRSIAVSVTGLDNLVNVRYPHPMRTRATWEFHRPGYVSPNAPRPVSTATPMPNPHPEPTLAAKV